MGSGSHLGSRMESRQGGPSAQRWSCGEGGARLLRAVFLRTSQGVVRNVGPMLHLDPQQPPPWVGPGPRLLIGSPGDNELEGFGPSSVKSNSEDLRR